MECQHCPSSPISAEGRSYRSGEVVEDLVCEDCGATALLVQANGQTTVVGAIRPSEGLWL